MFCGMLRYLFSFKTIRYNEGLLNKQSDFLCANYMVIELVKFLIPSSNVDLPKYFRFLEFNTWILTSTILVYLGSILALNYFASTWVYFLKNICKDLNLYWFSLYFFFCKHFNAIFQVFNLKFSLQRFGSNSLTTLWNQLLQSFWRFGFLKLFWSILWFICYHFIFFTLQIGLIYNLKIFFNRILGSIFINYSIRLLNIML